MDSLITAAARALAAGDLLGALKRVLVPGRRGTGSWLGLSAGGSWIRTFGPAV